MYFIYLLDQVVYSYYRQKKMCWTQNVSMGFAMIHIFTAIYVYRIKPSNGRYYIAFCLFYTCMELLQAFQWYIGVSNSTSCTPLNSALTYVAYILIWLQPVMLSTMSTSLLLLQYSIVTFCVAMINIFLANQHKYDIYRTN
jgi:hypothetical protein